MDIQDLELFLGKVKRKLDIQFPDASRELRITSQMVKVSEEVGELSEQVLFWTGGHMIKDNKQDKEALGLEIADVIISVGVIAQELGISLEDILHEKMKILQEKLKE